MKLRLALAGIFAMSIPAMSPMGAFADESHTVTCRSSRLLAGGHVSCNGYAAYKFDSRSPDHVYGLELSAPATHCSPVQYRVLNIDNGVFLGSTGYLNPGESQVADIGGGFVRGVNTVKIVAFGKVGGCNTGVLQSWGVSVHPVQLR